MFGYIRPLTDELKVKELNQFKACYCGLCQELGRRYGFVSRFILNYDLTFLAMLLWEHDDEPTYNSKVCIACKKCRYCNTAPALELSSDILVILTWWKLKDSVRDDGFFRSMPARSLMVLLRKAYRKAASLRPKFDAAAKEGIEKLIELENRREASIDLPADAFAGILRAAVESCGDEHRDRATQQLLYHIGRWIYIVDAIADLKEDFESGAYNPVRERFELKECTLSEDIRQHLQNILQISESFCSTAYELLPSNQWSQITGNIIYLGMPAVSVSVLNGTWNKKKEDIFSRLENGI